MTPLDAADVGHLVGATGASSKSCTGPTRRKGEEP